MEELVSMEWVMFSKHKYFEKFGAVWKKVEYFGN